METSAVELQMSTDAVHQRETGERPPLEQTAQDEEISREALHADEAAYREKEGPFRRLSRKLTRPDSLDVESMRVKEMDHAAPVSVELSLHRIGRSSCSFALK